MIGLYFKGLFLSGERTAIVLYYRLGINEMGLFQNWLNLAISDAFIDDSPCDERQTYNLKLHLKVGANFFFFYNFAYNRIQYSLLALR